MKQIVALSSARGVGRTSLVAGLAQWAAEKGVLVLADANAETPNLGLLLDAVTCTEEAFLDGQEALITTPSCTACARCAEVCRFGALQMRDDAYGVDRLRCVGCGACSERCSEGALTMRAREIGHWRRAETGTGMLFHARLHAGLENTGRLVTEVREQAASWAVQHRADYVLIDGAAGWGTPALASMASASLALIVAEPTVTGRQELERLYALVESLALPAAVIINRADVNLKRIDELTGLCAERGLPIVGRIPLDPAVTQAMRQGQSVTAQGSGPAADALGGAWEAIEALLA